MKLKHTIKQPNTVVKSMFGLAMGYELVFSSVLPSGTGATNIIIGYRLTMTLYLDNVAL